MAFQANLADVSVSVGFPCGAGVPWQTAMAMATTAQFCALQNIPFQIEVVAGCSEVTVARSQVVDSFLKSPSTHLFWIDSDIVWTPTDFVRLLAMGTQMDVVCAVYPLKNPRPQLTLKHPDMVNFELNDFGCVKIEGAGLGFTCVSRGAIERLVATKGRVYDPFHKAERADVFRTDVIETDGRRLPRGEDQAFFADLRELGFDVWLDPTVNLGHVGPYAFRADVVGALNLGHVYRPSSV